MDISIPEKIELLSESNKTSEAVTEFRKILNAEAAVRDGLKELSNHYFQYKAALKTLFWLVTEQQKAAELSDAINRLADDLGEDVLESFLRRNPTGYAYGEKIDTIIIQGKERVCLISLEAQKHLPEAIALVESIATTFKTQIKFIADFMELTQCKVAVHLNNLDSLQEAMIQLEATIPKTWAAKTIYGLKPFQEFPVNQALYATFKQRLAYPIQLSEQRSIKK